MAVHATESASIDAGLLIDSRLTDGQTGIAYGSCSGSMEAVAEFGNLLLNHSIDGLTPPHIS